MRTTEASAPAGSPENARWRRRGRRPTSPESGRAAGRKAEPPAAGKRVNFAIGESKRPGDLRGDIIADGTRQNAAHPCGAMPRPSVPLVRRLPEPRVRDSAAVHAEHRSAPLPFSFPVPRKNIASRRNHNERPKLITSTLGTSRSGGRQESKRSKRADARPHGVTPSAAVRAATARRHQRPAASHP
jgi:hypothetical protein